MLFPRVLPRVGLGDVLAADGTADEDVMCVHMRSGGQFLIFNILGFRKDLLKLKIKFLIIRT